jgi:hypothetical protein
MADIAAIFQWPLSEMVGMDLTELIRWRELAVERWNRMQGQE